MPTYHYKCDNCKKDFEFYQSFKDKLPEACFDCKNQSPIFYQIYYGGSCGWVYGNPSTVGQQADINRKKLGKELCQKKEEELKKYHGKARDVLSQQEINQIRRDYDCKITE